MKFSKEEKAMWLEDWRQSGKSAWTYAKENGLNPQTFAKWAKEGTEAEPCFVEMPARIMPPPHHAAEILIPLIMGRGEMRAVIEGLGAAL
jgi:transposase-like protein